VKLALRSLEEDGTIRVGILALRHGEQLRIVSEGVARDLTGTLLADVLSDKKEWEKLLEEQDSRAILIRHGSGLEANDSNSVFRTIYTDSPLFKTHNVEILVSTLNIDVAKSNGNQAPDSTEEGLLDSVLVPRLEAPASSAGGYSSVAYPIHKALLIGSNMDDVLAVGLFSRTLGISSIPPELIKLVVNSSNTTTPILPVSNQPNALPSSRTVTSAIDVSKARKAVASFRSSVNNAVQYQHGWAASGLADVTEWVTEGAKPAKKFKGPIKTYITELLKATSARISLAEAELQTRSKDGSVSPEVRSSISKAVDNWAEGAHRELRDSLDVAFSSKQWHKLAWWKLLWRVDEVGMITGDLLERAWLTYAEKGMVFLAGRVQEAGILERKAWETTIQTIQSPVSTSPPHTQTSATQTLKPDQELELPSSGPAILYSMTPAETEAVTFATLDIPYPQHIPAARRSLIESTVPDLHSLAQKLVMTTLSTTALTSALSALLYISFPLTSIYETAAIAAFGLVFGLSRMQNQWERAREDWQVTVREEGRRALMATEGSVRSLVAKGGRPVVDDVLVKEIEDAKLIVAECYLALDSIEKQRGDGI
jgi:hypothetical protein